jgi:hypothetical protein
LYEQLWAKEDNPPDTMFRDFEFPKVKTKTKPKTKTDSSTNTNPHETSKTWTAKKLSLGHISSGRQLQDNGRLPCGTDELLVREAYREMYDILVADQEDRMSDVRAEEKILPWKRFSLILGQPGIGKTWFLSYVLVRRLLEGKPTIFQVPKRLDRAGDFAEATHYLLNGDGVHPMPDSPSLSELADPEIWVLADEYPVGAAQESTHKWLVVVTSSPRKENHHYLIKEYSPRTYYLPAWDLEEIVAAA